MSGRNRSVVAEGVGTAAQAAALAEMGCRYGPGFHFRRPLPAPAAEALLGTGVPDRRDTRPG